jgi:D-glycero-D-manno-heptose 1,7-bisphosphate phosphatase
MKDASISQSLQIAVFLDRDGTINEEKGYLHHLDDLVLIPGVASAVRKLNDAGLLVILTTNQSGPARGYYGVEHVEALNNRAQQLLQQEAGARLDAMFYCPHLPEGSVKAFTVECGCRKPSIGMIQDAAEQFPSINLTRSYMVGDKATDIEFARNAGCKSILVKTGFGQQVLDGTYQSLSVQPTWICQDLPAAVEEIFRDLYLGGS